MKKVVAVFLLVAMLTSFSYAEDILKGFGVNVSSLSDDELASIINEAKGELENRTNSDNESEVIKFPGVIFDEYDCVVEVKTLEASIYKGNLFVDVNAYIENNTSYNIEVDMTIMSIDDWDLNDMLHTDGTKVTQGKKANGKFDYIFRDMNLNNLDDIGTFEFYISIWDTDRNTHNLYKSEIMVGDFV